MLCFLQADYIVCIKCARCRLSRLGATKPLFDPIWRAHSANTIGPIAPKICRPRLKPPGSKRQSSQTPVSARDGTAKMKVANNIPVQPVLARPPCQHLKLDCAQTLQTSRSCPTSTARGGGVQSLSAVRLF